jgi:hypothetical protein
VTEEILIKVFTGKVSFFP